MADLKNDLRYIQGRELHSIFIGGGTPSLMSVDEVDRLLTGINQQILFSNHIEITLEANPATAEAKKFIGFYKAGINRLSIGVQSFENNLLKSIGRIHNGDEAKNAILIAQNSGFKQLNVDLMYGLPSQNTDSILHNLQTAIDLCPSHLSHYQLTIEPNTYFAKHTPILPNNDKIYEAETLSKKLLSDNNYPQYEVSAYSSHPSKHNLNYWQFGDYLGIGAGAHSKLTQKTGQIIRGVKPKSPQDYLSNQQGKYKIIPSTELGFEFMLNALRLTKGFEAGLLTKRTGLPLKTIETSINKAIDLGLLTHNNHIIQPTKKGADFLNDLQGLFLT